jgi:hypothetical protein
VSTWTAPESRFQNLLSARTAAALGVVGAIVSVAVADLPRVGLALGCVSVATLYATYGVFSLLWGSRQEREVEWSYTLVGALSIGLALAVDPKWLALGWAMHGFWDALHHRDHHVLGLRGIPLWWIQSCLVWDVPAAVGLLLFV